MTNMTPEDLAGAIDSLGLDLAAQRTGASGCASLRTATTASERWPAGWSCSGHLLRS